MLVSVREKEASFPQDQTPEPEGPNPARGSTVMSSDPTVKGASHSPAMKPNEVWSKAPPPTLTPPSSPSLPRQITFARHRYYPVNPVIPLTREEAIARAKGASNSHHGELLVTTRREVPPNLTPAPSPVRASVKGPSRVQQGSSKSHLAPIPVIPPVRNGTSLRLRARSPKALSLRKQKSHAPHIPSPLAKEISATPSLAPSEAPEIRVRPKITFTFGKFFLLLLSVCQEMAGLTQK
jgi:hypothetical protein